MPFEEDRRPGRRKRLSGAIGLVALVAASALAAPTTALAQTDIGNEIRSIVEPGTHPWAPSNLRADIVDTWKAFYTARGFSAAWLDGGRPSPRGFEVVHELGEAGRLGLEPADYGGDGLEWVARRLDAPVGTDKRQLALWDTALSLALLRYLSDAQAGRVPPREIGFDIDAPSPRRDLAASLERVLRGDGARTVLDESGPPFDQYRRLLRVLDEHRRLAADRSDRDPVDGTHVGPDTWPERIRRIEIALERLRWLPDPRPGPYVVVNIPSFTLWGFARTDHDRPAIAMKVVVGRAVGTRTPVLTGTMTQVRFRPYWYVPPGILRNEIVPAWTRDPGYLAEHRMEIVDAAGRPTEAREAAADIVRRLLDGSWIVRQRPGPDNALGLVKFVFPNRRNVRLHDTPAHTLFERSRRDFSHGCVRVADPVGLARFVLSDNEGWDDARIRRAMRDGPDAYAVDLRTPVSVVIYYTTTIVGPEDRTQFLEDIYGHDRRLDEALHARSERGRWVFPDRAGEPASLAWRDASHFHLTEAAGPVSITAGSRVAARKEKGARSARGALLDVPRLL